MVLGFQEIDVGGSRKAIIIFVPVPQLKSFQKIQVRLVRELEKKFSGKHVVFVAQVRNPFSDLGQWLGSAGRRTPAGRGLQSWPTSCFCVGIVILVCIQCFMNHIRSIAKF